MIKQWWTAQELADLELSEMPVTKRRINSRAQKESWQSRPRKGRGGGKEYHISNLPQVARLALIEKLIKSDKLEDVGVVEDINDIPTADLRRDARLIILGCLDSYRRKTGAGKTQACREFSIVYGEQAVDGMPSWIYDVVPSTSARTLRRWLQNRKDAEYSKLGRGQNNRKGTGVLDLAENGAVKNHIGSLILKQPHLTAGHIRDLCRAEFGEVLQYRDTPTALPNIRTFTRFIAKWKEDNAELIKKETDPDNWKNAAMLALGSADAKVNRLNRVWEIDASPADVMCEDGRYNLYAIVDVWSRRMLVSVTKTAATEGSLLLLRRAIKEWGVPEILKTDNGADFVSHRFVRALNSLGIVQSICSPFSPEKKPYVERAFGTLQRDLMPLLPGFIGHSVKDRKAIEGRKAFAQRLGMKDEKAFAVSLTHEDLQAYINDWCADKYGNKEHSGIKTTPNLKAASWMEPVQKIENERALDLLLAPIPDQQGCRTITKKGLRINNGTYFGRGLEQYVGKRVFVRCDPDDMGLVYCFDPETQDYICDAVDLEMQGVNRQEMAEMAKIAQKKYQKEKSAEYKKGKRNITPEKLATTLRDQAREDSKNLKHFPHREDVYTSPELEAATSALTRDKIAPEMSKEDEERLEVIRQEMQDNQEFKAIESDEDRWFARWKRLDIKINNGVDLDDTEAQWYADVQGESWWISRRDLERMREGVSQK